MPKHSPRTRIHLAVAALFLVISAACSKPEERTAEPVVPVQAVSAKKTPIRRIIQAQAVLYPDNQASVVPKVSAPVSRFYVNRGDRVHKGQLLAELENRDLAAAALEAKANYDQAEAAYRETTSASLPDEVSKARSEVRAAKESLDAAQKLYESRKDLFEQGALPRKLLDEANAAYAQARSQYDIAQNRLQSLLNVGRESQLKSAQAQLEAAKGRMEAAQALLQYTIIRSPIDGVVAERPLYEGEMATAGTPLMTIMNITDVIARANLSVNELRHVKAGESARIQSLDSSIAVQGKVTVVSPALNPNSTTAEVWVQAPNPNERLHPGAAALVFIMAGTVPDALVIPSSALLPSTEGIADTVLVVGPDSLAHRRQVEIGIKEDNTVQILKGLNEGDRVVTVGGYGIQDGTKVSVEEESAGKSNQHDE